MATVFEIVEKLRSGEDVILNNKHLNVFLQQMTAHKIPDIRVVISKHDKNHKKLTLSEC